MVISNSRLSLRQGTVQAGISKSRYQVAMKQLDFKESIEEACKQVTEEMCRKVCRSAVQRFRDCLDNEGQFLSY
jgi:SOS response regulatory protein OraA/RecX